MASFKFANQEGEIRDALVQFNLLIGFRRLIQRLIICIYFILVLKYLTKNVNRDVEILYYGDYIEMWPIGNISLLSSKIPCFPTYSDNLFLTGNSVNSTLYAAPIFSTTGRLIKEFWLNDGLPLEKQFLLEQQVIKGTITLFKVQIITETFTYSNRTFNRFHLQEMIKENDDNWSDTALIEKSFFFFEKGTKGCK